MTSKLGKVAPMVKVELVTYDRIENTILIVRGHRVMLDRELAMLYGVETRALIQAVKRNLDRFPADFMFQLTADEAERSRSQVVILNAQTPNIAMESVRRAASKRGSNIKYLPYAFTEQGVAMLSSVLRSSRAVQVNIEIMRAFVRLRQMLQANTELAKKLATLEKKYDAQFRIVFDAIRDLMTPPAKQKRRIGFRREDK
jgi:hypothetical protein